MNEWHQQNEDGEEVKSSMMMGQTRILDYDEFQPRGKQHQIDNKNLLIDGANQGLQESINMEFNAANPDSAAAGGNRIDINDAGCRSEGLQSLTRVASVEITEFDWKYENFGFGFYQYVIQSTMKN